MKQAIFKKGNLTKGLDGIEEYLGFDEGQTVFLNEYCIPSANFPDLSEPGDWVLGDTWSSLYPMPLAAKKSGLLAIAVPQALTWYLEKIGLIPQNANIIEATDFQSISQRYYPQGSAIGQIKAQTAREDLSGKIIIPSFVTTDSEICAQNNNSRTLIPPSMSIVFNSKSFLRKVSKEFDYTVSPGVIIQDGLNLDKAIEKISNIQNQAGTSSPKVWLKFATAAGGGTVPIENLTQDAVKDWTLEFLRDASTGYLDQPLLKTTGNYDDLSSTFKRDLVLEVDLNAIPNITVLGNYGLQAVIGDEQIVYLGATEQITEDGDYIGGQTLSTQEAISIDKRMLPEVRKVFEAYWEKGYRGVMGVDALLTKQNEKYKTYILEANCRMTAATPLLAVVQKLQGKTSMENLIGRLVTFPVTTTKQDPEETMQDIFNQIGSDLYAPNKKSGVVPFIADVFPGRKDPSQTKVRCVVIDESAEALSDIQMRTSKRLAP